MKIHWRQSYILASLAVLFVAWALTGDDGFTHPRNRTWLLIAVICATVSGWLFYRA